MKKIFSPFVWAVVLLMWAEMQAQRRLDLSRYELVWSEEFDYQDTAALFEGKAAKWINGNPYRDPRGNETDEQNRSTNELTNNKHLKLANGCLYLSAKGSHRAAYSDSVWYAGKFWRSRRSSSFITANLGQDYPCEQDKGRWLGGFAYGIIEARIKLENKEGDYPAFWLWGDPYQPCSNGASVYSCLPYDKADTLACPPQGFCPGWEIDVFEAKYTKESGQRTAEQFFWATIQANGWQQNACMPCASYYRFDRNNPQERFFTYTLAWTPDSVSWFINGNELRTQRGGIPRGKLNLILSNSTFGNGQGGAMVVDYVRIYRPTGQNYQPHYSSYRQDSLIWDWPDTNAAAFGAYYRAYGQNSYVSANYQPTISVNNSRVGAKIAHSELLQHQGKEWLIYSSPKQPAGKGFWLQTMRLYPDYQSPIYTSVRDTISGELKNAAGFAIAAAYGSQASKLFYINQANELIQVDFARKQPAVSRLISKHFSIAQAHGALIWAASSHNQPERLFFAYGKGKIGCIYQQPATDVWEFIDLGVKNYQSGLSYQDDKLFYIAHNQQIYTLSLAQAAKKAPEATLWGKQTADKGKIWAHRGKKSDLLLGQDCLFYQNELGQIVRVDYERKQATILTEQGKKSSLRLRYQQLKEQSLAELFYIDQKGKIHSLYEYAHSPQQAVKSWREGSLDIFSAATDHVLNDFIQLSPRDGRIYVQNRLRSSVFVYEKKEGLPLGWELFHKCGDDSQLIGLQF